MHSQVHTFLKPPTEMSSDPVARSQHDILLLDINMPGRSGLEVLKDVSHIYPQLPVIMVSVQPESQYASRCLRAGANRLYQQEQRFR